ncbi:hypothetical protein L0156_04860 [bacterium]|nr:hypothetical protein [bacterium]
MLLFILIFAARTTAQEHQHDDHHEQLGEVSFAVSCAPDAQKEFNRGVALLHDFWYAESEKTFSNVAAMDPQCAMAYWE